MISWPQAQKFITWYHSLKAELSGLESWIPALSYFLLESHCLLLAMPESSVICSVLSPALYLYGLNPYNCFMFELLVCVKGSLAM